MSSLLNIAIIAGILLVGLVFVLLVMTRLYRRATKETAFVRTGLGGQKVILDGGALVFPVLHEIITVNMTTLKLPVSRRQKQALITKDRMRVDVDAEFFVRVKPETESIANAAQTLGGKTMHPDELRTLIEGKFVDALRSVAASMEMNSLHEQRADFVQQVQNVVSADILKNGLELESVSLTGLDQTNKADLDPNNAFDAEGLAKLTQIIESRRKLINDTEQETRVQIEQKNLDATQRSLEIRKQREYTEIETERELANRRAEQQASIAKVEAERNQEAEAARLSAEREIERQRLEKDQSIATRNIEKRQAEELAEQQRQIAVAQKSEDESKARASAEDARAAAVRAAERVETARAEEQANRAKSIELIKASEQAERDAIGITVSAKAEKEAATDRAEAVLTEARAKAEAEKVAAEGTTARYEAEATGKRALNAAENTLGDNVIALRLREALLQHLPSIIAAAAAPMDNIDSIKIVDMHGAGAVVGGGNGAAANEAGGGSLPEQVVNAALRHRVGGPLLDTLMAEVGINGGTVGGMLDAATKIHEASTPQPKAPAAPAAPAAPSAPSAPSAQAQDKPAAPRPAVRQRSAPEA